MTAPAEFSTRHKRQWVVERGREKALPTASLAIVADTTNRGREGEPTRALTSEEQLAELSPLQQFEVYLQQLNSELQTRTFGEFVGNLKKTILLLKKNCPDTSASQIFNLIRTNINVPSVSGEEIDKLKQELFPRNIYYASEAQPNLANPEPTNPEPEEENQRQTIIKAFENEVVETCLSEPLDSLRSYLEYNLDVLRQRVPDLTWSDVNTAFLDHLSEFEELGDYEARDTIISGVIAEFLPPPDSQVLPNGSQPTGRGRKRRPHVPSRRRSASGQPTIAPADENPPESEPTVTAPGTTEVAGTELQINTVQYQEKIAQIMREIMRIEGSKDNDKDVDKPTALRLTYTDADGKQTDLYLSTLAAVQTAVLLQTIDLQPTDIKLTSVRVPNSKTSDHTISFGDASFLIHTLKGRSEIEKTKVSAAGYARLYLEFVHQSIELGLTRAEHKKRFQAEIDEVSRVIQYGTPAAIRQILIDKFKIPEDFFKNRNNKLITDGVIDLARSILLEIPALSSKIVDLSVSSSREQAIANAMENHGEMITSLGTTLDRLFPDWQSQLIDPKVARRFLGLGTRNAEKIREQREEFLIALDRAFRQLTGITDATIATDPHNVSLNLEKAEDRFKATMRKDEETRTKRDVDKKYNDLGIVFTDLLSQFISVNNHRKLPFEESALIVAENKKQKLTPDRVRKDPSLRKAWLECFSALSSYSRAVRSHSHYFDNDGAEFIGIIDAHDPKEPLPVAPSTEILTKVLSTADSEDIREFKTALEACKDIDPSRPLNKADRELLAKLFKTKVFEKADAAQKEKNKEDEEKSTAPYEDSEMAYLIYQLSSTDLFGSDFYTQHIDADRNLDPKKKSNPGKNILMELFTAWKAGLDSQLSPTKKLIPNPKKRSGKKQEDSPEQTRPEVTSLGERYTEIDVATLYTTYLQSEQTKTEATTPEFQSDFERRKQELHAAFVELFDNAVTGDYRLDDLLSEDAKTRFYDSDEYKQNKGVAENTKIRSILDAMRDAILVSKIFDSADGLEALKEMMKKCQGNIIVLYFMFKESKFAPLP